MVEGDESAGQQKDCGDAAPRIEVERALWLFQCFGVTNQKPVTNEEHECEDDHGMFLPFLW